MLQYCWKWLEKDFWEREGDPFRLQGEVGAGKEAEHDWEVEQEEGVEVEGVWKEGMGWEG